MKIIAALFVATDGVYFGDNRVDPWDLKRDARKYNGILPVVAHPPCQLWGKFAKVNYARWGGVHNMPGNDSGCFASAIESVRSFGGVLEHPASSYAFDAFGITKPDNSGRWVEADCGGYVCEVWQSDYGHLANKKTWLYYYGKNKPFDLRRDKKRGSHQIGFFDKRGKARNKPTLSKKEANATPLAFKEELINLAILAGKL